MATGSMSLPPGYTLEQPQQGTGANLPPGYALEQPDSASQQPSSPTQQPPSFLQNVEGGLGEAGHDIAGAAKGMVSSVWDAATSLTPTGVLSDGVKQALPIIDAYEKTRSGGGSITDSLAAASQQFQKQHTAHVNVDAAVKAFKANPTRETARGLADAGAAVAAGYGLGAAGDAILPEEAESGAAAASGSAAPEAEAGESGAKGPSLVQKLVQGKKVAQEPAKAAIREAAGAEEEAPIINATEGNTTILDEPLNNLRTGEKAAYKELDDAAGFDLKAERDQLANDQYKLKQLGNTEADQAAREKLTGAIQDSQDRISDVEGRLKAGGIDPTKADAIHQLRMAGIDLKKAIIKNMSADGESVNVDGLLRDSKALRFSKRGDRLTQFLGKDGADKFMGQMDAAQKAGAGAVKVRNVATWVAGGLGFGGLAEIGKKIAESGSGNP